MLARRAGEWRIQSALTMWSPLWRESRPHLLVERVLPQPPPPSISAFFTSLWLAKDHILLLAAPQSEFCSSFLALSEWDLIYMLACEVIGSGVPLCILLNTIPEHRPFSSTAQPPDTHFCFLAACLRQAFPEHRGKQHLFLAGLLLSAGFICLHSI